MQRFAATAEICGDSRAIKGADRARVYRWLSPVREIRHDDVDDAIERAQLIDGQVSSFMNDYTALRAYSVVSSGRYVASEHRIRWTCSAVNPVMQASSVSSM